ncbi:unnamed protein product, partial [Effrenium voratum]
HARARGGEPPALMELRRRLTALPATPGPAAEELVTKLKEEQTSQALKAVDARTRTAFFAEVRVNLHRLTEGHQKELLERFGDLKTEVVKLVDSLTQEISVWLDEERVASTWQNFEKQDEASEGKIVVPQFEGWPTRTVVAWKTAEYGFVKREGRHNDDIQLHVANAKGESFKNYIKRYGMAPGVRVKFDVDFEENRGRPYASNWEMVDPPRFSESPGRSKGSPSARKSRRRSPSARRRSKSPSVRKRSGKRDRSRSRSERKSRRRSRSAEKPRDKSADKGKRSRSRDRKRRSSS